MRSHHRLAAHRFHNSAAASEHGAGCMPAAASKLPIRPQDAYESGTHAEEAASNYLERQCIRCERRQSTIDSTNGSVGMEAVRTMRNANLAQRRAERTEHTTVHGVRGGWTVRGSRHLHRHQRCQNTRSSAMPIAEETRSTCGCLGSQISMSLGIWEM